MIPPFEGRTVQHVIEFRILGPVEVLAEGHPIEIPQARLRALLAILLLNANEVVSTDRLIDALWGEQPPSKAGNALQVSVSRLRKLLPNGGEPFVQTRYPGYVIELEPAQLDLRRFETLAGEGRESLRLGEPVEAARLLREALAVWHGPALADLTSEAFAQREAERLEESRLAALELRIEADLATGEHAGLVAELESLVAAHPYREGFRGQLMLALYRAGRQAEALEAYQLLRQQLVDDLGIEPSRSLQQLERAAGAGQRRLGAHARLLTRREDAGHRSDRRHRALVRRRRAPAGGNVAAGSGQRLG